ncbi:MAG: uroporphyrinogen decarboxylase family protein [Chloroflexota bacterium]|nr:uroporphyrinogen decarboxylase family protein [Chloroflexota bacterium]
MYDWLLGTRRVAAAILGTPDCVPIYGPLPDHAMYLAGVPSKTFYTQPALFVEAQLLLAEYYGFDLPYVYGDVYNIEAEALGQRIIYRERAAPLMDRGQPLIQAPAELDRIETPDFFSAGRLPFVLETYRLVGEQTGLPSLRWFCAPFSLACAVRTYSRLVHDMQDNPSFVHALLERLTECVLVPWIRCSLRHHPAARAATGVDAWASFPIITWDIFWEYVVPYARRLRDVFAQEGYEVVVSGGWGDSRLPNPVPLLEERIRLQGALRGLDPDVQRLGPELYATVAARHDVALGLGLDSRLIHDGPVEAIAARVKSYIQAAAPRGRLTLIINNVPGDTPPEHIHATVAAARTYGQYPIADDLDAIPFEMPDVEPFVDFARRRGWKYG